MSDDCIPVEELARVAELPAGDPGRRHLDTCERCQGLLAMLQGFAAPPPPAQDRYAEGAPSATRPVEPDAIAEEVAPEAYRPFGEDSPVEPAPPAVHEEWAAPVAMDPPQPSAPPARYAETVPSDPEPPAKRRSGAAVFVGIALVVVVIAGAWMIRSAMRPASAPNASESKVIATHAPQSDGNDVELAWEAAPRAEHYRVVFFDAGLREVAHVDSTDGTRLMLRRGELPEGLASEMTVGWQVQGLVGGVRVAHSVTRGLKLP